MTIQRPGRVAGGAALALVLAGCGGDSDRPNAASAGAASGGSPGRVEACDLVQQSELESITGAPVTSTKSDFDEQTHSTPVTYSARCMYLGEQLVTLIVHYPTPSRPASSAALASRLTEELRSQAESDPSTAELLRTAQVRPVEGLGFPTAAYEVIGDTHLEAYPPGHTVKITAPSLDQARQVAEKAAERLN